MNDTTAITTRVVPDSLTIAQYMVSYSNEIGIAANRLSRSFLLPDTLRIQRKDNDDEKAKKVGDVGVLLARCLSTGEDFLSLAQSIYLVGGRVALASRYLLARAQQLGKIRDAPQYRVEGEYPRTLAVTAVVVSAAGVTHEVTVTMQEAKEDGWMGRNAKYRSPKPAENMLRHRAAARLIDQIAPGVRLGLPIAEEVMDEAPRQRAQPIQAAQVIHGAAPSSVAVDVVDAVEVAPEVVEVAPEVVADAVEVAPEVGAPDAVDTPSDLAKIRQGLKDHCAALEAGMALWQIEGVREKYGPRLGHSVQKWSGGAKGLARYRGLLQAAIDAQPAPEAAEPAPVAGEDLSQPVGLE
tara:strand:+ start:1449 stop:2504 length:1056 start_codon:yes stop_codon:yes gene_type:complete